MEVTQRGLSSRQSGPKNGGRGEKSPPPLSVSLTLADDPNDYEPDDYSYTRSEKHELNRDGTKVQRISFFTPWGGGHERAVPLHISGQQRLCRNMLMSPPVRAHPPDLSDLPP